MVDDPAIAAVAAYWEARDALDNAKREKRGAWREAAEFRSSGGKDAMERAEAVDEDASRAYGRTLRSLDQSRKMLASASPATPRGAIEMLTSALAEFSEPFDNLGTKMVFCTADVPDLIRSIRDASELWETKPPHLKEDEPK